MWVVFSGRFFLVPGFCLAFLMDKYVWRVDWNVYGACVEYVLCTTYVVTWFEFGLG